jgi:hypothetical protein
MAILATPLPAHRFWPLHGEINISEMSFLRCSQMLSIILKRANVILEKEGSCVVFLQHVPQFPEVDGIDPHRNLLLGIKAIGKDEPIDILDLKALDETSLKSENLLVEEVVEKVRQHQAAKKTQGILFSSSGSKLDQRLLNGNPFAIDDKGYLRLNDKRLCVRLNDKESMPLKACQLRTYTIMRAALDGQCVQLFDEYDFVRLNKRTMFIDLTVVHQIKPDDIASNCREDAANYDGSYHLLERGTSTPALNEKLAAMFHKLAAL